MLIRRLLWEYLPRSLSRIISTAIWTSSVLNALGEGHMAWMKACNKFTSDILGKSISLYLTEVSEKKQDKLMFPYVIMRMRSSRPFYPLQLQEGRNCCNGSTKCWPIVCFWRIGGFVYVGRLLSTKSSIRLQFWWLP